MAGLGRRTFAAGEVLTASNVMNFLQDQAVMNFADDGARGSAIGTAVSEGMVSYLADTNLLEVYDGSAWKQVSATTGNILQVVSTTKTDTQSTTVFTEVTGLNATITPKSATSKIYVLLNIVVGANDTSNTVFGFVTCNNSPIVGTGTYGIGWTALRIADVAASFTLHNEYLHSPNSTSELTYRTYISRESGTVYVNRGQFVTSGFSTLTLIEVAG
jgi:hypothetical protein